MANHGNLFFLECKTSENAAVGFASHYFTEKNAIVSMGEPARVSHFITEMPSTKMMGCLGRSPDQEGKYTFFFSPMKCVRKEVVKQNTYISCLDLDRNYFIYP